MSTRKSQEELLRERIKTRETLLGINPNTQQNLEKQNKKQNVLQNENEPLESKQTEKFPAKRRRRPRSKEELEKEKFHHKYKPRTFYVRPDLLEKFDRYSGGIRGEKTRMINEALKEYLDTFEDE